MYASFGGRPLWMDWNGNTGGTTSVSHLGECQRGGLSCPRPAITRQYPMVRGAYLARVAGNSGSFIWDPNFSLPIAGFKLHVASCVLPDNI